MTHQRTITINTSLDCATGVEHETIDCDGEIVDGECVECHSEFCMEHDTPCQLPCPGCDADCAA